MQDFCDFLVSLSQELIMQTDFVSLVVHSYLCPQTNQKIETGKNSKK